MSKETLLAILKSGVMTISPQVVKMVEDATEEEYPEILEKARLQSNRELAEAIRARTSTKA